MADQGLRIPLGFPLLANPTGTAAAPSYAGANDATSGIFIGTGTVDITTAGNHRYRLSGGSGRMGSAITWGWTSGSAPTGNNDAQFGRSAAGAFQFGNGSFVQSFTVTAGAASLATFNGGITTGAAITSASAVTVAGNSFHSWTGRSRLYSPADGTVDARFADGVTAAQITCNIVQTKTLYTVATLPAAATAGVGSRAIVSDALAPAFGVAVAGGGAVVIPVYSDGAIWLVG